MLADYYGIRQIARLQGTSRHTISTILAASEYAMMPKQSIYNCLEVDEFWTFIQRERQYKGIKIIDLYRLPKKQKIVVLCLGVKKLSNGTKVKSQIKAAQCKV